MEFRGIKYDYEEWTTYSGDEANCFSCSDPKLLDGLALKYFAADSIREMEQAIGYYIDNKEKLIEVMESTRVATQDFYDKLLYKGD